MLASADGSPSPLRVTPGQEYWWIPLAGNQSPKLLDLAPGQRVSDIRVNAAGPRIALVVGGAANAPGASEVWVLERFLPPAATKKK